MRADVLSLMLAGVAWLLAQTLHAGGQRDLLDDELQSVLARHGFTGRIESTLEQRLGRRIDRQLANTGRLLFFDTVAGLNNDNNCSGCHAPTNGFGDTQSIAIGVDNNGIVGPGRSGPRNQRRSPMIANTAFFSNLMWNSRFAALSDNPFDNSAGFMFPEPEGFLLMQNALTDAQKEGALLFFGAARCVECYRVSGPSNEMFSDFAAHVIGVPQIAVWQCGLRRTWRQ